MPDISTPTGNEERAVRADVLVAGAGMAGLTAALRAQSAGASVVVLEAGPEVGGSAALAAGHLKTFGDYATFRRLNPSGEPDLARAIPDSFEAAVAALSALGVRMETDACLAPGHRSEDGCCGPESTYTRHYRMTDTRQALMDLARAFLAGGGRLETRTRVKRLVAHTDGRVTGAVATAPDGPVRVSATSVVLATGGFQGNKELLARYVGPWAGRMLTRSNPWSVGDGFLAGIDQGAAATDGLHAFYGHLVPAPPAVVSAENFLQMAARYTTLSVLVSLAGKRFVDESVSSDGNARAAVRQQEAAVFAVFDAEAERQRVGLDASHLDRLAPARDAGARFGRADSMDGLVRMLGDWGVRPASALRTLTDFNQSMESGNDDVLDAPRLRNRLAIGEPPFFAIALIPGITFTFGGLRTDAACRVLDRQGARITGLYAAGADAGGTYVERYGGGLAMALTQGFIAGGHAASNAG